MRRGFSVDANHDLRNIDGLLHVEVDESLDVGDGVANLLGIHANLIEVLADDLDGERCPLPREHMVDAVRDGLAQGELHPWNRGESLSDIGEELCFAAGVFAESNFDLRRLDALNVLVSLGASCAPRRRHHGGVFQERSLGEGAKRVGLFKRGSRKRDRRDRQTAFVELRQKRAPREAEGDDAEGDGDGARRDDRVRAFEYETKHGLVTLSKLVHERRLFAGRVDGLRQKQRAHRRSHGDGDQE